MAGLAKAAVCAASATRRYPPAATAECWGPRKSGAAGRGGSARESQAQQVTARPARSGSSTVASGRTDEVASDHFTALHARYCARDRLLPGSPPFCAAASRRGSDIGQRNLRRKLDADMAAIRGGLVGQQHLGAGRQFCHGVAAISERTYAIASPVAVSLPSIFSRAGRLGGCSGAPLLVREGALLLDPRVHR